MPKLIISGIFWLIVGIVFSIWATRYQIGSLTQPGPAIFPLLLGLLLIFLSLISLRQTKRSSVCNQTAKPFSSKSHLGKVIYTILVLLSSTFLFEKIGYLATLFLLMVLLLRGSKLLSWKIIIFIAFFTVFGVYIVFVLMLNQPLPRGILGI